MEEAIASDIVVKLLELLGGSMAEKIAPYFNGRNKLEELEQTMKMIQARLVDAERLREGENGALINLWLQRLKRVLCRLEDLFEEVSMADQEYEKTPGGKFTKNLRLCFSHSSPFKMNKKLALEANATMEELKSITFQMHSLNFRVNPVNEQHSRNMAYRQETHSFILEEEVIGRDIDKKAIVELLLGSNGDDDDVLVIPIVGIGGIGKTTLAQLVFNDENVENHFDLKCWACISEISSLEELVRKILKSMSSEDCNHFSMEQLQRQLQRSIRNKRYLLVLDDVWDEDRERWLHMKRLLRSGKRGSKLIVTSRSRVVAVNMGRLEPYELKGLSEDKSWELFKSLAYRGQEEGSPNLINLGWEIVKKCANVPLAIRTIAGLLYSKDTEMEWETFMNGELRMIEEGEGGIMSTLKLSYNHLTSHLKQCFAYCCLFPKDFQFTKKDLIYLWIAQGFIRPSNASQSLEVVGHGYFMELLRRSFLQDEVKSRKDGEVISCKMHDLMHDLARLVSGADYVVMDSSTKQLNDDIWHVNVVGVSSPWEAPPSLFNSKRIRSFLLESSSHILNINQIFSSLRYLRALDLIGLRHLCVGIMTDMRVGDKIIFGEGREHKLVKANCNCIPDSLGMLKHLRYLRLGFIVSLPSCITMLQNLQTLDLPFCHDVKEFPKNFSKLRNLRHFHNKYGGWDDMPLGFNQLTSLHKLDLFIVGETTGLNALGSLNNLSGELEIQFEGHRSEAVSEAKAANIHSKKLTNLLLSWTFSSSIEDTFVDAKAEDMMLEHLHLPLTLETFKIVNWKGARFSRWGMLEFPNIVSLHIDRCRECKRLPLLSQLPYLKELELYGLDSLEYVEDGSDGGDFEGAYFPSLKTLTMQRLPQLKAWSKENDIGAQRGEGTPKFFPCLTTLYIKDCPKLKSTPYMPNLKSMIT